MNSDDTSNIKDVILSLEDINTNTAVIINETSDNKDTLLNSGRQIKKRRS